MFGDWTLRELEGAADDIARWRAGLADTSRYRLTLALRQTLGAAVRWRYMARNPAVDAGRNPEPRSEELLPFTPDEIDALERRAGAGVRAARRVRRRDRAADERVGRDSSAATSTAPARRWSCSAATPTAC